MSQKYFLALVHFSIIIKPYNPDIDTTRHNLDSAERGLFS